MAKLNSETLLSTVIAIFTSQCTIRRIMKLKIKLLHRVDFIRSSKASNRNVILFESTPVVYVGTHGQKHKLTQLVTLT